MCYHSIMVGVTMKKETYDQGLRSLSEILTKFPDADACGKFLEDLCTPCELQAMIGRWQVALMLNEKISYRKINKLTGVSTATITRVARFMESGFGGYKEALHSTELYEKTP